MVGLLFFTFGKNTPYPAYAYFYIPMLWIFWLFATIYLKGRQLLLLSVSWMLIAGLMLFVVGVYSSGVANFCQSKGLAEVFMVSYFPIILPLGMITNTITEIAPTFLTVFDCSGFEGALSVWLEATIIGFIQSAVIVVTVRITLLRRRTRDGEQGSDSIV